MNTEQIAKRLVELCRKGEYEQAQRELYAQDAVSIEMPGAPAGALGDAKGLEAIYEKGRQWAAGVEAVHASNTSNPTVAGNWFSVAFSMDMTFKGRGRMQIEEIGVYHVRDGKVVSEQFFYDMG
ncbi:MAG: nuclear transport factor 2 family protein [Xanthomonadaceae bacterium]|nr:nuclear transport factor 2 family protein [Xanthomonadaceae bacterium]